MRWSMLYLKHLIWRSFDSRNHAGRVKSALLYLCKVVSRVAIEHHLSNWYQREFRMWPDLQKKNIKKNYFNEKLIALLALMSVGR